MDSRISQRCRSLASKSPRRFLLRAPQRWIFAASCCLLLCTLLLFAAQLPAQEPAQGQSAQAAQTGAPTAEAARVTLQGTVRNAATGDPLPRALVQIEGDADTGALTDGEGRFEIPGVATGPQTIRVVKPGFRDRPYATEDTNLEAEGPAHSVIVAAQMPQLAFALSPDNAIRGRVELSTGDPADEVPIILLKRVVRFGRAEWAQESSTRTNGDGSYRFGSLPDGTYALYTQPVLESEPAVSVVATASAANVARSGFPSVFYPDARDFAGAARIPLSAGSQAEANFSLALEPFYPVTASSVIPGKSASSEPGPAGNSATITGASGQTLPYLPQYDPSTHSLQVSLPDGTYTMLVHTFSGGDFAFDGALTQARPGSRSTAVAGAVAFTVAGHPVTGLRIPLAAPPQNVVNLRILRSADNRTALAGAEKASDLVNLSLDPAETTPQSTSESLWSMTSQQDSIDFTAQPGSYWLTASMQHKSLCVGALIAGGLNLAHDPLPVSLAAAPPALELDLHEDCATLALTLPPGLATLLAGEEPFYTVYIVPDFDTVQEIAPMTMHPSSGATLTLDGLTPGSYHVYSFDLPVHLEYRNPQVLAALGSAGQQVTLTAGSSSNLVLEVPQH